MPNGARKALSSPASVRVCCVSRKVMVAMVDLLPSIVILTGKGVERGAARRAFEEELEDLDVPLRLLQRAAPGVEAVPGEEEAPKIRVRGEELRDLLREPRD